MTQNQKPWPSDCFRDFLLDMQIRFGMGSVRENTGYTLAQLDDHRREPQKSFASAGGSWAENIAGTRIRILNDEDLD
jgi:hypothetical protein